MLLLILPAVAQGQSYHTIIGLVVSIVGIIMFRTSTSLTEVYFEVSPRSADSSAPHSDNKATEGARRLGIIRLEDSATVGVSPTEAVKLQFAEGLRMKMSRLCRKAAQGWPYLVKELRAEVSNRTRCFIARPRIVHLWRKGPCDGGCITCHLGYTKGKEREELFRSRITDEMMPGLLQQIQALGGRGTMVSYMCGEPLLNRSVLDWVEQAKRLRLDFRFTTNGYHVDRAMAQRLVAARLFNLGASIESLDPAINEQIRPYKDSTHKVVTAIELLLEEKRRQHSPISFNLKCTLTNLNLESVLDLVRRYGLMEGVILTPQVFEVLAEMPPETIDKLRLRDTGRVEAVVRELKALKARGYHINADDDALDSFVRVSRQNPDHHSTMYERKVRDENQPDCFIGTDNLFIMDDHVRLCPHLPLIGDVVNDRASLKEMWQSEPARQVREQIRKCRTVCTMSCTRRMSLAHKVRMFLKM